MFKEASLKGQHADGDTHSARLGEWALSHERGMEGKGNNSRQTSEKVQEIFAHSGKGWNLLAR